MAEQTPRPMTKERREEIEALRIAAVTIVPPLDVCDVQEVWIRNMAIRDCLCEIEWLEKRLAIVTELPTGEDWKARRGELIESLAENLRCWMLEQHITNCPCSDCVLLREADEVRRDTR